nr:LLM class flavin-dependent oxidoreductase [Streptomyces sp. HNM0575]
MHLNVNVLQSGLFNSAWRAPDGDPHAAFSVEHYIVAARIAEASKLDALFLADTPVLGPDIRQRPEYALEPTVILGAVAARTSRIGLIGTVSSTYNEPYDIARRFAALDHLSRGRAGLNVVTTAGPAPARNFGLDREPERAERYRRAGEFTEVVTGLFDSWEDGALVGDAAGRRFADIARIHAVDHEGEFFRVRGPLNTPRPPQGRPVLVQAGGSAGGRELAAGHAEAVFSAAQTLEEAHTYASALRARAGELGRDPERLLVLPGLSTVVAGSRDEALERWHRLTSLVPLDLGLSRLAGMLGLDPADLDPDKELPWHLLGPVEEQRASHGFYATATALARREKLTPRQLIGRLGGSSGHRLIVGGPEEVADSIEEWFTTGAADGFNLMPDVVPSGLTAFCEHVLPELRRRGLFRRDYEGHTLREHFGLDRPPRRERTGRSVPPTAVA